MTTLKHKLAFLVFAASGMFMSTGCDQLVDIGSGEPPPCVIGAATPSCDPPPPPPPPTPPIRNWQ